MYIYLWVVESSPEYHGCLEETLSDPIGFEWNLCLKSCLQVPFLEGQWIGVMEPQPGGEVMRFFGQNQKLGD